MTAEHRDWARVLREVHTAHGGAPLPARTFSEAMTRTDTLAGLWRGCTALSAAQRVGRALAGIEGRDLGGFTLRAAGRDGRAKVALYRVEANPAETPQTPQSVTETAESTPPPNPAQTPHGATIPALPGELLPLLRAAATGSIHGGAALPSGLVPDLGGYVLAWAASYLLGDHSHALQRLSEARQAWRAA